MPHEPSAFRALLLQHAEHEPDAVAVQGPVQRFTYRQLLDEVESRIARLQSQPPGAFVVALDNGPEVLFWDLAALFAERPCVIIPSFFSAAQFHHCLRQSGATIVLCEQPWTAQLLEQGFAQQQPGDFWTRPHGAIAMPAGTAKIT